MAKITKDPKKLCAIILLIAIILQFIAIPFVNSMSISQIAILGVAIYLLIK